MKKVDRLAEEPSFGILAKTSTINLNGLKVATYLLNKKQAIAVGAKLNNSMLMALIDKLEELSKPKHMLTHLETARLLVESLEKQEALMLENKTLVNHVNMLVHTNKLYTATEIAKEIGLPSAQELNKRLHEMGIQFNQSGTWVMYSRYSTMGYESIKQEVLDTGKIVYHRKFTGAGRSFILSMFGIETGE
jgi:phage antirepressor YoqD-like protein